jgi:predicted CXXCH cytochrome family protein
MLASRGEAGIKDNLHNLSADGPGNIKSGIANRICEFCHIAHSADDKQGPLWARKRSAAIYIPYSSSTAIAQPGQPTGTSVLCLSCHDGTIALGEIINRGAARSNAGGLGRMPPGKGLQGTDLSDDHPISFKYTGDLALQSGELAMPGSFSEELKLDKNGELQCTTCHDPHDSPYEKLLVVTNLRSQLCIECHNIPGWEQSSHSLSEATWNKRPPDPWRDNQYDKVAENACDNCHISHTAKSGARLLKHANEENNCSSCHNGNVASKDLMADFKNNSIHPVYDTTLVHDPAESVIVESRHVECADCHDPHGTLAGRDAGDVPANVRGVNLAGGEIDKALTDYEICLRCHGDSPNQPRARTPRQHDQTNIRLEIQPSNPSFHPIADRGRNENVPSLIFPLNEESVISCGSCHNSSSAQSAGGSGPEGPHGSEYAPLLVRNYLAMDNTAESASAYALCYSCHSRDSILNDESFPEHNSHVVTEKTTCNACHDPHGISSTQGDELNNSHLINFDTSIVSSNSSGLLQFVDNGEQAGSCDLLCHGKEHNNLDYQN